MGSRDLLLKRGSNESHRIHRKEHQDGIGKAWLLRGNRSGGAWEAVDHYKRSSQATKKGAMFDDCLYRAKVWCEIHATKSEKPKKKTRAKKTVGTLALF